MLCERPLKKFLFCSLEPSRAFVVVLLRGSYRKPCYSRLLGVQQAVSPVQDGIGVTDFDQLTQKSRNFRRARGPDGLPKRLSPTEGTFNTSPTTHRKEPYVFVPSYCWLVHQNVGNRVGFVFTSQPEFGFKFSEMNF